MKCLLFKKKSTGTEIICENIPRYGVVVVVVVMKIETAERPGRSDSGAEVADMFLRKFIVDCDKCTNYFDTANF